MSTYNTWGSVHLDRHSSSSTSSSSKISRSVSLKTLRSVSNSDKLKAKEEELKTNRYRQDDTRAKCRFVGDLHAPVEL